MTKHKARAEFDHETGWLHFLYKRERLVLQRFNPVTFSYIFSYALDTGATLDTPDVMSLIHAANIPERRSFNIRTKNSTLRGMRVDGAYYSNHYAIRSCRNCHQMWCEHVQEQCLFEPTKFDSYFHVPYVHLSEEMKWV